MIPIWINPVPVSFRFAEILGWFAFSVLKIRRKVVMANLTRAFPELEEKQKINIGLKAYQNFAKFVIEYIRIPIEKKEKILEKCRFEGLEHIDAALERGKGAVVVGGHFGNFELMGSAVPMNGYPTSFLVGRQHNARIDNMINANRALAGVDIIHMGVAVRGALKALKANKVLVFLSDQDARTDGVFVNFFNTPASTPQGAAVFASKTGAALIFGTAVRIAGTDRHRIIYQPCQIDGLKGASSENIRKITQDYTALLESWIRKFPELYFWMHRRWKTKPESMA